MATCFVIQPFDKGKFDKRYEDVFKPAIIDAGYEPYRVDQDPSVSIPIEEIEKGIRSSEACLVDITLDNPNVWFELGMAFAASKDVVLICSDERTTRYPFDIQHRKIIPYTSGSVSDFNELIKRITERLIAIARKQSSLESLPENPMVQTKGLSQHEIVALISIAQNIDGPGDYVSAYLIRKDMENYGYTKIATTIALNKLLNFHYVEHTKLQDRDEQYSAYNLSDTGMKWLIENQEKFNLTIQSVQNSEKQADSVDNDIPF